MYNTISDSNWQTVALVEGWAHYREWLMKVNYFNPYFTLSNEFPYNYGIMFRELISSGCSYSSIEKALKAFTIEEFKNNLIDKYPLRKAQISGIIRPYE
ncbi:MAG: hypothetical protein WCL70_11810 [Paludibacter sp.]